jgi:hypothetical protein
MKLLSGTLVAAVCAFGIRFDCFAQAGENAVTTGEVQIACHRPYEKYTSKEGEKILAYLSLLGLDDVQSYQRSRGLIVDGVAGPETCGTVMKELSARNLLASTSSPRPIDLKIVQTDGGLRLSISNQTDRAVVLLSVGSLVSAKDASRELSLPITALASGQSRTGALIRKGTKTEVRIVVPSVIQPGGFVGRPLRTRSIGSGVSELRSRFVAVINTNQVEIIETAPLKLPQLIEFE